LSQRKFILNILEIVGKQNMDDLDTGLLLEDIKSFHDRVEKGKYYDHWGRDEKTHNEKLYRIKPSRGHRTFEGFIAYNLNCKAKSRH